MEVQMEVGPEMIYTYLDTYKEGEGKGGSSTFIRAVNAAHYTMMVMALDYSLGVLLYINPWF